MRATPWSLALLAVAVSFGPASAQEAIIPAPEQQVEPDSRAPLATEPIYRPYREEPVNSLAQRLIHERAYYKAQHRRARIESQKWLGISTARPTVSADYFCTEQNPVYYGWAGSYRATTRSPWVR